MEPLQVASSVGSALGAAVKEMLQSRTGCGSGDHDQAHQAPEMGVGYDGYGWLWQSKTYGLKSGLA